MIVSACYVGISSNDLMLFTRHPRPRVVPEDVWEMPAPCLSMPWNLRLERASRVYGVVQLVVQHIVHDPIETNTHTDDHNWSHMVTDRENHR